MDPVALPDIVNQDFSLIALFMRSDPIVKTVMIVLGLASVWSWAVAIDKWFGVMGARSRAKRFEHDFWSGRPLEDVNDRVSDRGSDAMARVFSAGAREWRESRGAGGDPKTTVERAKSQMDVAVNRETMRMESGLSTLAIIASSSPFVGLFGTVIGIYRALIKIGASGQASISTVAGPVGEALIMTALGLVVAVPAVLAYNWLIRRNKSIQEDLAAFTNDVHGYLMSNGAVKPVMAAPKQAATARPATAPAAR